MSHLFGQSWVVDKRAEAGQQSIDSGLRFGSSVGDPRWSKVCEELDKIFFAIKKDFPIATKFSWIGTGKPLVQREKYGALPCRQFEDRFPVPFCRLALPGGRTDSLILGLA